MNQPTTEADNPGHSGRAVLILLAVIAAATIALTVTVMATLHRDGPTTALDKPVIPTSQRMGAPVHDGPQTTVSDGTYQVGHDMAPGRYTTTGPTLRTVTQCYWARNRDDPTGYGPTIDDGNINGPAEVTVNPGEYFQTFGACTWTKQ